MAREKLAEAEAVIRASKTSFSTLSWFHNSWADDPFLSACDRHRLQRNPRPESNLETHHPGGYPNISLLTRALTKAPSTPHWTSRLNPLQ